MLWRPGASPTTSRGSAPQSELTLRLCRHLIADHIGWFKESTEDGKLKTVEDLVRAKGETVRRGHIENGEVIEYAPEDS